MPDERATYREVHIHQGAKRRFGDGARKVTELTPGDLLRVASATEAAERRSDRGAEVSKGHSRSVDEASEALRKPKGGETDRPSRERGSKARTRKSGE